MHRDPEWSRCDIHSDMIQQEGRAAAEAANRAELKDQHRQYWVEAAWRLRDLIASLRPGTNIPVATKRECGSIGCRHGEHPTGTHPVPHDQLVEMAQQIIDGTSRSCQRLTDRADRRPARPVAEPAVSAPRPRSVVEVQLPGLEHTDASP